MYGIGDEIVHNGAGTVVFESKLRNEGNDK